MPRRKISIAQLIVLVPVMIKALAWFLLLLASIMKLVGYPEVATLLFTISSTLGIVDAKKELDNIIGGQ